ncbi:MAG: hypothetical protein AAB110_07905 [Candidatus Desantisbacteria bacterium]
MADETKKAGSTSGIGQFIVVLFLLCLIIGLLIASFFLMDTFGVYDKDKVLQKFPIVGSSFAPHHPETEDVEEEEKVDWKETIDLKMDSLKKSREDQEKKLKKWEQELKEKEQELKKKEQELSQREQEVFQEKVAWEKEKSEKKAEEDKWQEQAACFEKMSPKKIIEIFQNMDDRQIINILKKMNSSVTSAVLAKMEPKRAAEISRKMTR